MNYWKPYENIKRKEKKKSWLSLVMCSNAKPKCDRQLALVIELCLKEHLVVNWWQLGLNLTNDNQIMRWLQFYF
jgi:hypothetical protein